MKMISGRDQTYENPRSSWRCSRRLFHRWHANEDEPFLPTPPELAGAADQLRSQLSDESVHQDHVRLPPVALVAHKMQCIQKHRYLQDSSSVIRQAARLAGRLQGRREVDSERVHRAPPSSGQEEEKVDKTICRAGWRPRLMHHSWRLPATIRDAYV